MFRNSTPAPDTALPEDATVPSAEAQHRARQHAAPQHAAPRRTEAQHRVRHQSPAQFSTNRALTPPAHPRDAAGATEPADVEITAISPTEWRIADQAIEHDDPNALLGFIQIVGTAFEVTNLGRPRERAYFTSFDRATASLLPREVLA
ncbi:hypothetical protein K2F54_17485 [Cryobacterium sp. 1639]|uniref:hypothetical protein n=1 Tax=Cryobacterium inferilacus TaxID=2866629 RepID=UPI001C73643E|nr:hypothetical protein [Cryobacterium sp. 1639]MBX0301759.1 hypothetical protein [Cryobacterium sp. 1639]